jgi:threonine dehydratase
MRAFGAEVRLEGEDFDGAKFAAKRWAAENGALMVEDGRQPEISEGAGTIGLELLERGDAFDAVLVPLGNGALLTGVARWVKAHAPGTRVIGVSSVRAAAMRDSWLAGRVVEYAEAKTIADGIAVRVPIAEAVEDMRGIVNEVVLVEEASIHAAMRLVMEAERLVVERARSAWRRCWSMRSCAGMGGWLRCCAGTI